MSRLSRYFVSLSPRASRTRSARSCFCSAADSGITITDCVAGNHRFDAPTRISRVSFLHPFGVERVEMRMTAPAVAAAWFARPRPAPRSSAGAARRTRIRSRRRRPCRPCGRPSSAPGTPPAAHGCPRCTHEVVGELVEMAVDAGQQVASGYGGTPGRLARRPLRPGRCTWRARSRPGRYGTGGCCGSRTGRGRRACRSRCSAATAGTPGPARRGRCPPSSARSSSAATGSGRSCTSGERSSMRTTSRSRGAWICGIPSRRRQMRSQSSSPAGITVNCGRSMIAPGP